MDHLLALRHRMRRDPQDAEVHVPNLYQMYEPPPVAADIAFLPAIR